ncbi:MAG: hypothetical protein IKS33_08385 [Bacteroidales bacterium]|jgi:hypothetical protein|nr:hypothetical protein [Bacteroidales bacterium]
MKKKSFKLMTAVVMGAVLMMAFQCSKNEEPEPVDNYNAHHSKCLDYTDKDVKGFYSPDSVSVVYDAARQRLHVTHHNLVVNCGTAGMDGGIIVSVIRNGQTIDIYENEDENNPQANCICDVDNEFDLYSIEHGTYTLVFHSSYPNPLSVTFTF